MPEQLLALPVRVLCQLSGEDTRIILDNEVDTDVAGQFAGIGFLVLVIFVVSFYSSIHFIGHVLSGNYFVVLGIGLFWGGMIAVIYYLLLFTVTPAMLKGRERASHGAPQEVTEEKKGLARLSLGFRLLFVILLAMVIAQPWLVTLFPTARWIEQERAAYRAEFGRLGKTDEVGGDGARHEETRSENHRTIDRLLAENNFYTRRVQMIHRYYPAAWVVTGIVILFFVLPIGLKYHIRNGSNFYAVKKKHERDFVLAHYAEFKQRHAAIFASRFGIVTEWYESCTDPPFNTRKRGEEHGGEKQQLLLNQIYGEGEEAENNKYFAGETIS